MKSKIIIGIEFIIFLLLLGAVIVYSQVLIKKVIDKVALEAVQVQEKTEEQKIEVVATSTNKNSLSVEEKYAWLEKQRVLSSTSPATSVDDKKAYLVQTTASSSIEKQWTIEEKMKFLETR